MEVRYTTDGVTIPSRTDGTIYSEPVRLDVGETTIMAVAYKPGFESSNVVEQTFTVLPSAVLFVTNHEIKSAAIDGSNPTLIADGFWPMWSADRSTILFLREASGLYIMNSDGSDQQLLFNNVYRPAFSPDGTMAAFEFETEIVVIATNGSGQLNESASPPGFSPAWSPDSSKIAFSSTQPSSSRQEIWVMDPDGSNQTKLTDFSSLLIGGIGAESPTWSPDGTKIAFLVSGQPIAEYEELYVMNVDGSNQIRLTTTEWSDLYPAWSPDGGKIAFVTDTATDMVYDYYNLFLINPDGTGHIRVTNGSWNDLYPKWTADGSVVFYETYRYGAARIHMVNSDGSNERALFQFHASAEELIGNP